MPDVLALWSALLTKPLLTGSLFSASLVCVLTAVVDTKPLRSCIFYQHHQFSLQTFLSVLC